jgi:aspartyl-tRNA(Asn)/glutamyl-tRNA(Gln) amidotransferase subunit C
MSLDRDAVARIAHLARLQIPNDRQEDLADELSRILSWIEQLQEVATDDTEPMTSVVQMALKTREDRVCDGGIQDQILANAPETTNGYFVVDKVIE